LVAALAPAAHRGAAFGAYHFTIGIAALPASVIFGLIWQRFGAPTALFTGASLAATAAVLLMAAGLDSNRGNDGQTDDGSTGR
jgi:predicted MFS family arabinose efflux permease